MGKYSSLGKDISPISRKDSFDNPAKKSLQNINNNKMTKQSLKENQQEKADDNNKVDDKVNHENNDHQDENNKKTIKEKNVINKGKTIEIMFSDDKTQWSINQELDKKSKVLTKEKPIKNSNSQPCQINFCLTVCNKCGKLNNIVDRMKEIDVPSYFECNNCENKYQLLCCPFCKNPFNDKGKCSNNNCLCKNETKDSNVNDKNKKKDDNMNNNHNKAKKGEDKDKERYICKVCFDR